MNNLEKWCSELLKYWQNKDVDNIVNLFDENVIYYENPKVKVDNIDSVRTMWEEINDQDTSHIEFNILCQNNNKCIANFILYDEVSYDMIYEIELNNDNKCIYFKQWFMEL